MNRHSVWMMIGCALPLLLIFFLPLLGIRSDLVFFAVIVLMFVGHLFMMRGHGKDHGHDQGGANGPHRH